MLYHVVYATMGSIQVNTPHQPRDAESGKRSCNDDDGPESDSLSRCGLRKHQCLQLVFD